MRVRSILISVLGLLVACAAASATQHKTKKTTIKDDGEKSVTAPTPAPSAVPLPAPAPVNLAFSDNDLDEFISMYTDTMEKQLARDRAQVELDSELGKLNKMWIEQLKRAGLPASTGFRIDVPHRTITPVVQIPPPAAPAPAAGDAKKK